MYLEMSQKFNAKIMHENSEWKMTFSSGTTELKTD